jgi:sporulation protein YlmC with PRC-barrel domain
MDEGQPIAYLMLDRGVTVISSDGEEVGRVHHVVAASEQDIFHGLVIDSPRLGKRFVPAEDVASLHERGVDLRINAGEVAELPPPSGAAPEYRDDVAQSRWDHWARRLTLRNDWRQRR